MEEIIFKTGTDVTDKWINYISSEANSIAQLDEFGINNYVDRQVSQPQLVDYLSKENIESKLFSGLEITNINPLALSFAQEMNVSVHLPDWLRPRFAKLKTKIKKILCDVTAAFIKEGKTDWKAIIGAILLALIPAFAGGVPAIILPIVIGLVAQLMKYGYNQVCPV